MKWIKKNDTYYIGKCNGWTFQIVKVSYGVIGREVEITNDSIRGDRGYAILFNNNFRTLSGAKTAVGRFINRHINPPRFVYVVHSEWCDGGYNDPKIYVYYTKELALKKLDSLWKEFMSNNNKGIVEVDQVNVKRWQDDELVYDLYITKEKVQCE